MSDFLPYGDSGPAEAAAEAGVEAGGGNKKALLGALAGVLVLALVGYFVVLPALSGGDSGGAVAVTVNKKSPKTTTKAPAKKAAAAPKAAVTTTYNDSPIRDPFKPLWLESNGSTAPGAVAPGTAVPGTTNPGTVSPGSTGSTGSTGSSTVVSGQRVALVKVFARNGKTYAQTRVGETVFTPAVGEQFAGSFQLLATSGRSATYLFGDEQFNLSEGQEVLK